jgi:23S rRNA G2069 N7-methylase RlmK/C1962 C5-methylase RlmI
MFIFFTHMPETQVRGIPDPNGTAVVMTCTNIIELEQYLYCLSMELHTNSFEIVLVQLNICKTFDRKTKCFIKDQEYQ